MARKLKAGHARNRAFPTMRHCVALAACLLAFLGVAFLLSCAAPPVGDQGVTSPAVTAPPTASAAATAAAPPADLATLSILPTSTAGSVTAGVSPVATASAEAATTGSVPVYGYEIVNTFPHDPGAFTEGLVYTDGVLYEGTGLRGESTLRRVDLETGKVLQLYSLPPNYFGEGITVWDDRIIQLTWQERTAFAYDKDSFALLHTFYRPTEGWGITHDGTRLIMSDGTATLYFLDPESLEEIGRVQVYDNQGPVTMLNELEYVRGQVYANVWLTNRIAIIDPWTGQVTAWIDLEGLLEPEDYRQGTDVLNGIAYDSEGDRLFVTGKRWPKLFEIKLVPHGTGG
jgi:glutaminyl-peptide cyclotransferase